MVDRPNQVWQGRFPGGGSLSWLLKMKKKQRALQIMWIAWLRIWNYKTAWGNMQTSVLLRKRWKALIIHFCFDWSSTHLPNPEFYICMCFHLFLQAEAQFKYEPLPPWSIFKCLWKEMLACRELIMNFHQMLNSL